MVFGLQLYYCTCRTYRRAFGFYRCTAYHTQWILSGRAEIKYLAPMTLVSSSLQTSKNDQIFIMAFNSTLLKLIEPFTFKNVLFCLPKKQLKKCRNIRKFVSRHATFRNVSQHSEIRQSSRNLLWIFLAPVRTRSGLRTGSGGAGPDPVRTGPKMPVRSYTTVSARTFSS